MSAAGREVTAALRPGSRREARQAPEASPLLSAFPMLCLRSLASLIYGEQSEKTSPSEIPLEMEHKDKVSGGGGPGSAAALLCAGRNMVLIKGCDVSQIHHCWPCDCGHIP